MATMRQYGTHMTKRMNIEHTDLALWNYNSSLERKKNHCIKVEIENPPMIHVKLECGKR